MLPRDTEGRRLKMNHNGKMILHTYLYANRCKSISSEIVRSACGGADRGDDLQVTH